MNYQEALNILKSFEIEEGNDWDRHCINVGDIAWQLALELQNYTDIDPEETRLMGLVHDFGRSVTHDPFRHAYEGYKLLTSLGCGFKLARICVCHSNGTYRLEEIGEYGLKPEDFFVHTLQEKLVFIGDSIESHGKLIRHSERISETIGRYKRKNPEFVPMLESKLAEFKAFDRDIEAIMGKGVYEFFNI